MVSDIRRSGDPALNPELASRPEHRQRAQSPSGRALEEPASLQKVSPRKVQQGTRRQANRREIRKLTIFFSLIHTLLLYLSINKCFFSFLFYFLFYINKYRI